MRCERALGLCADPGAYLADKVTSPFWKKRKIAFLSSCESALGQLRFARRSHDRTQKVVSYRPTTREHSPSRRMLARPYAECEPSREATHRDRHGVAWHRPHPLPGCRSGCGERCRDCAPRCGTAAPTGTSTWTSRSSPRFALERLAASEEASDAALRRLRDRAAAREEVARRIAAMSSGDAQTWRQKNESRGERDESESAALVRRGILRSARRKGDSYIR